jgi:hypothetical protein
LLLNEVFIFPIPSILEFLRIELVFSIRLLILILSYLVSINDCIKFPAIFFLSLILGNPDVNSLLIKDECDSCKGSWIKAQIFKSALLLELEPFLLTRGREVYSWYGDWIPSENQR